MAEIFLINREPADSGQGDTPYVGAGKISGLMVYEEGC